MAQLQIVKPDEGRQIPLDGDKFVMGRNPDCAIVIPVTSVSREHAQIVRVNGKFFIEDKQSRNGTFVNSQAITGRTPLKNNDKIRICDFLAVFLENGEADEEERRQHHRRGDAGPEQPHDPRHAAGRAAARPAGDQRQPQQDAPARPALPQDRRQPLPAVPPGRPLLPHPGRGRRQEAPAAPGQDAPARRRDQGPLQQDHRPPLPGERPGDPQRRRRPRRRVPLSQSVVDFRIRSFMCVPLCAPTARPSASSSSTPSTAARNSPRKTSNCSGASPTRPPSPWRTPGCTRRRSTRKRCGATWSWRIRCR